MCDYSLHSVRTRPAKAGEKLVTRDFRTGTRGFAAPEDCSVAVSLEFPDGKIVLLTRLYEGQNATVLTLPSRPKTAAERRKPKSASPTSADTRRCANWRTRGQAAPARGGLLCSVYNVAAFRAHGRATRDRLQGIGLWFAANGYLLPDQEPARGQKHRSGDCASISRKSLRRPRGDRQGSANALYVDAVKENNVAAQI